MVRKRKEEEDLGIEKVRKRYPRKLPISLTPDEFRRLMRVVKKKHHKLAYALGFMSGMRVSEVVNLRKEDVDFNSKQILVKQGKGGKDRIVPMPKSLPLSYYDLLPLKCGVRNLQKVFKAALKRANIIREGLRFHSLRHGFATRALEAGMPLNQIQLLLGHSNIRTTSIYVRANPKEALKKYEELF